MAVVDVRKVIQELIVPELQEIKSDIKVINARLNSLERELISARDSLGREIVSTRDEIRNLREEFKLALDIH